MSYSTIKRKHCKGKNCNRYPMLGLSGWCWSCAPAEIKEKLKNKKKEQRGKLIEKSAERLKAKTQERKESGINEWFKERRKEMTGKCIECRAYTNIFNSSLYKFSICHVVPKSLVPSVKTHPINFIELCIDHHTMFDANFQKAASMRCFEEAKRRFNEFKHLIPADQLSKVSPYLKY